jgi:hypothetical protein
VLHPRNCGREGATTFARSRYLEAEEVVNECCLPSDVILRQPPYLSLTNHVHRFDSLKCAARRVEGAESLTRSDPPFDGSVILLLGCTSRLANAGRSSSLASGALEVSERGFGAGKWVHAEASRGLQGIPA